MLFNLESVQEVFWFMTRLLDFFLSQEIKICKILTADPSKKGILNKIKPEKTQSSYLNLKSHPFIQLATNIPG